MIIRALQITSNGVVIHGVYADHAAPHPIGYVLAWSRHGAVFDAYADNWLDAHAMAAQWHTMADAFTLPHNGVWGRKPRRAH